MTLLTPAGFSDASARRVWVAVGVVAAVCATLFAWGGRDFCLDDAWIHLAYAKSLRLGDGFSYNPGDWETGSSSPLWVALLALFPVEHAPLVIAKGLGIVWHAVGAATASSLAGVLARRWNLDAAAARGAAIVAGLLVALQPTLLQAAVSGMEVSLTSALLLVAARLAWADRARAWLALLVGACAVWARPEALFFLGILCVGSLCVAPRNRAAALLLTGAVLALGGWVVYCLAVSGHAWPNTRYVKATGGDLSSLGYLAAQVLPWQPWLAGLGGVVLVGAGSLRAVRGRQWSSLILMGAWLGTLIATALSRRLDPEVFFYLSRYFDIVAGVPAVVVALGFACSRVGLRLTMLAPVAVVTALQVTQLHARVRAQEEDIRLLHSQPARLIARALPAESVVIVEGAGASRFFTPRRMRMVDMLGLNDRVLAHAHDDYARACALLRRRPTHVLVPDRYVGSMASLFGLRALEVFSDPRNTQTAAFAPRRVVLAEITRQRPEWSSRCSVDTPAIAPTLRSK